MAIFFLLIDLSVQALLNILMNSADGEDRVRFILFLTLFIFGSWCVGFIFCVAVFFFFIIILFFICLRFCVPSVYTCSCVCFVLFFMLLSVCVYFMRLLTAYVLFACSFFQVYSLLFLLGN